MHAELLVYANLPASCSVCSGCWRWQELLIHSSSPPILLSRLEETTSWVTVSGCGQTLCSHCLQLAAYTDGLTMGRLQGPGAAFSTGCAGTS